MATSPSSAEIHQHVQYKRSRLEDTYRLLRLRIKNGLAWRKQAANHWKFSLGAAALGGLVAGKIIGRWIWKN